MFFFSIVYDPRVTPSVLARKNAHTHTRSHMPKHVHAHILYTFPHSKRHLVRDIFIHQKKRLGYSCPSTKYKNNNKAA